MIAYKNDSIVLIISLYPAVWHYISKVEGRGGGGEREKNPLDKDLSIQKELKITLWIYDYLKFIHIVRWLMKHKYIMLIK